MNSIDNIILCSLAQSHILLLLQKGTIFDKFRNYVSRNSIVNKLVECPMCLGFWIALVISFCVGGDPISLFAIAGLGHIITLLRDKYLPCKTCTVSTESGFKVIK